MTSLAAIEDINSKSPLLTLPNKLLKFPNELLFEVASHLERFRDLNALLRTSRFFRRLFHTLLYRRAITANDTVRDDIVSWVLSEYRVASLTLLLDNGLSANHKFRVDGSDLLRTLCRLDDSARLVPLARLLIERGADIEAKDATYSNTVLHTAVHHNGHEIAALLMAHGANVNATNTSGHTPLHTTDHCDIAKLLVAHGADVNAVDTHGLTPLHCAAFCDNLDIATLLLEYGADVNAVSGRGFTPLEIVAVDGCGDFATLLLVHGADVEAPGPNGDTPLLMSLRHSTIDVTPVLLAHGANARAHNTLGETSLHVLFDSIVRADLDLAKVLELVKLLLEHGADVNATNFNGWTLLHLLCGDEEIYGEGDLSIVELLLEHGADVNTRANDGPSPLLRAFFNFTRSAEYKERLIALLIAHGVDWRSPLQEVMSNPSLSTKDKDRLIALLIAMERRLVH
jgi:ankyrin repeat protein